MKTPRSSPLERQLQVYEEGWKQEHDEAMRFWDFQENLSIGIAIFNAITHREASWRQRVSQGLEPFHSENNDEVLGLFRWWLSSCDLAMARLAYFEQEFGSVDGATEFRRCCAEAKKIVDNWIPPKLSKSTGLHAAEFSEADAGQLKKVLESGAARLRARPRPIQ